MHHTLPRSMLISSPSFLMEKGKEQSIPLDFENMWLNREGFKELLGVGSKSSILVVVLTSFQLCQVVVPSVNFKDQELGSGLLG